MSTAKRGRAIRQARAGEGYYFARRRGRGEEEIILFFTAKGTKITNEREY